MNLARGKNIIDINNINSINVHPYIHLCSTLNKIKHTAFNDIFDICRAINYFLKQDILRTSRDIEIHFMRSL